MPLQAPICFLSSHWLLFLPLSFLSWCTFPKDSFTLLFNGGSTANFFGAFSTSSRSFFYMEPKNPPERLSHITAWLFFFFFFINYHSRWASSPLGTCTFKPHLPLCPIFTSAPTVLDFSIAGLWHLQMKMQPLSSSSEHTMLKNTKKKRFLHPLSDRTIPGTEFCTPDIWIQNLQCKWMNEIHPFSETTLTQLWHRN